MTVNSCSQSVDLISIIRTEVRAAVSEALKAVVDEIKPDEYLSISELASRLGLCRQTVSTKLKEARIHPRLAGRYSLKEVLNIKNTVFKSRSRNKLQGLRLINEL